MKKPPASVPKPRLTHAAIRCADLDRSIAFYQKWCGLEVVHRRRDPLPGGGAEVRVAWLGRPESGTRPADFWIVLLETRQAPGPTSLFDHLGFDVPSRAAVDECAARAQAAGLLHWSARDLGSVVGYLCSLTDPDGNIVEFSTGQKLKPAT